MSGTLLFLHSFPINQNNLVSACTTERCWNRSSNAFGNDSRRLTQCARRSRPQAKLTGWPDPAKTEKPQACPGVRFSGPPPLSVRELLEIVKGESKDERVNEILRALLGWQNDPDTGAWDNSLVPDEWAADYPAEPPDFIGNADDYSPVTDRPVKKAVQKLTRSIPSEHKQISREVLAPMGFTGWKVNELTPNRTRRATAVNWILYYMRVHFPDHEMFN